MLNLCLSLMSTFQYTAEWLTSYLARAATVSGFLSPNIGSDLRLSTNTSDTIRMLSNTGVRYAGRAAFLWGQEQLLPQMLPDIKRISVEAHRELPDLVLEAAVFEIVTQAGVESLRVPEYVFEAFDLPVPTQPRTFSYPAMLFPDGRYLDQWGTGASVPDLTQQEARLWFFYLSSQYILHGAEALHCGQIQLMSVADEGMALTHDLFNRIRAFAADRGRRGFALLNAHLYADPFVLLGSSDQLLFDFHAFPARPVPDQEAPTNCSLAAGFSDAIYGKSAGGRSVGGFQTASLPYLVELDNYDCTAHPGEQDPQDLFHPFGWDEVTWFAHQPAEYRDYWLWYATGWLAGRTEGGESGHLQMPMMRCLCDATTAPAPAQEYYYASDVATDGSGFAQEQTIKQIWGSMR